MEGLDLGVIGHACMLAIGAKVDYAVSDSVPDACGFTCRHGQTILRSPNAAFPAPPHDICLQVFCQHWTQHPTTHVIPITALSVWPPASKVAHLLPASVVSPTKL